MSARPRDDHPAITRVRVHAGWNTDCNGGLSMRTTLGQLVSELCDSYERMYRDPELAAVATSVTLEEVLQTHVARRYRQDDTVRHRKPRG